MRPNIYNLDEDVEAVHQLSLAALEAAGNGKGKHAPKARRVYQAYKLAMDGGATEDDAVQATQAALSGRH